MKRTRALVGRAYEDSTQRGTLGDSSTLYCMRESLPGRIARFALQIEEETRRAARLEAPPYEQIGRHVTELCGLLFPLMEVKP
jgi:hypothetical protein